MAIVQTRDVSWSDDFDHWADIGASATLTMSLRDDLTAIDCSVTIHDSWARKGSRTDYGDGYVNMVAYSWAIGGTGHKTHPKNPPETWAGARSQFEGDFPSFFDNLIWAGWASDRGDCGKVDGNGSRTIWVTDDMWDADHNLKGFPIVYIGDRWFGSGSDELLHNRVRGLDGFAATDFDWSYFPWAKSQGGVWLSCNRPGGAKQAVSGGSWQDRKNDLYRSDRNTGHYYDGGWSRSPIVGRE